jgi:hypothetical protein
MEYFREISEWEFAIFKWSSEIYDPDECFFLEVNWLMGLLKAQ